MQMIEHAVRLYYIEVVMSNKKRANEKKYQNFRNKLILYKRKLWQDPKNIIFSLQIKNLPRIKLSSLYPAYTTAS